MAVSATTPLNSNPVTRTCSEKQCTNALVRPFKGNICSSCSARIRSRSGRNTTSIAGGMVNENSSNPSSKNVEHSSSIPNIVLPTSLVRNEIFNSLNYSAKSTYGRLRCCTSSLQITCRPIFEIRKANLLHYLRLVNSFERYRLLKILGALIPMCRRYLSP